MIKFFKNLYYRFKYKNSNQWTLICEINDTDMTILVYRLVGTNHIEIQIFDKIIESETKYQLRDWFTSSGNLKYATMLGYGGTCEECDEQSNVELDDVIKEVEENI